MIVQLMTEMFVVFVAEVAYSHSIMTMMKMGLGLVMKT